MPKRSQVHWWRCKFQSCILKYKLFSLVDDNIFRPTSSDGPLPQTTLIPVLVTPDLAVPRWISGKQTQSPTHSLPTPPYQLHHRHVRQMPAVEHTQQTDMAVPLTQMDATGTHTVLVTIPSTDLALLSTPPKSSPSSPNSSVTQSLRSTDFTSKTAC